MGNMTITEALAEIKTIKARVGKRQQNVMRYFARDARLKDPLEKEGGSAAFIRAERQGISDLLVRMVALRTAIQKSNVTNKLTVQGGEKTVADWLNWRREVSDIEKSFIGTMVQSVTNIRNDAKKKGMSVAQEKESGALEEIVIAIDEKELAQLSENIETVLGELDGKLSLVNATTVVEIV